MSNIILPILSLVLIIAIFSCGKSAANVYLNKGKVYYNKHKYQMAIRFFEKTLEVDSTIVEAKYYRAMCYYGLGHHHKSCEEMTLLLEQGYAPADTTLKKMGCFYMPQDTVEMKMEN